MSNYKEKEKEKKDEEMNALVEKFAKLAEEKDFNCE